jgi:hypothetical protein
MEAECLECLIGATRVEVPVAEVERLVEYHAAAGPPLAEAWLGGIGIEATSQGDALFLSVRLTRALERGSSLRGLLFRAASGAPRWALEVDRVIGLRKVVPGADAHPLPAGVCPPHWLRQARDEDGEPVRLFDVSAAAQALSAAEVAR